MDVPEPSLDSAADEPDERKDGLEGAAGLLPEDPDTLVEIAVGKTQEGESLPANPNLVNPVPLSMTTAGVLIEDIVYKVFCGQCLTRIIGQSYLLRIHCSHHQFNIGFQIIS